MGVVVGDILGSFILRNTFDENGENALFKACRHLSSYECWEKVEYLLETHHFDRTHKNNNLHTALDVVKKLKVMHLKVHTGIYILGLQSSRLLSYHISFDDFLDCET